MIEKIQVSLYDFFGYLLPGGVFLLALVIFSWTIFWPQQVLKISQPTFTHWVIILLLSYFLGHLIQAVANLFAKIFPSDDVVLSKKNIHKISKSVIEEARSEAKKLFYNYTMKKFSDGDIYNICDETVRRGKTLETREIYLSLEGFYRGLSISNLILALTLFLRIILYESYVKIGWKSYLLGRPFLLFVGLILLICFFLFFIRYRRFLGYRIKQVIYGFLEIRKVKPKSANQK